MRMATAMVTATVAAMETKISASVKPSEIFLFIVNAFLFQFQWKFKSGQPRRGVDTRAVDPNFKV